MRVIRDAIDPPGRPPERRQPPSPPPPEDGSRPTTFQGLLLDTAVGIPVLCILSVALLGGVENALAFLFFAVICTLGFSLLVLVPLAWVLGALIRRPIVYLLSRTRRAPSAA